VSPPRAAVARPLALAAEAANCLLPAVAHAGDLPARLRVEREPGAEVCPDQRSISTRVEAILRRPSAGETAASELEIDVRFEHGPDGAFLAQVTAHGPKPGQRSLRDTDPTCGALGEAVSVAIALLLDSEQHEREDTAPKAEAQAAPLPAGTTPKATSTATTSDTIRASGSGAAHWKARAWLEVGASYGLGGDASLLGFGRLGARHGAWSFDVGAGGALPSERSFRRGSVQTSLVFASVRGCYLLGRSISVGPCLHWGAGRLRGEGGGYGQVQSASLPWTAGGAGVVAEAALGSGLFASFGVSLWVSTRRQTFSVENAGIAWESRPVAASASAGLGVTLF